MYCLEDLLVSLSEVSFLVSHLLDLDNYVLKLRSLIAPILDIDEELKIRFCDNLVTIPDKGNMLLFLKPPKIVLQEYYLKEIERAWEASSVFLS